MFARPTALPTTATLRLHPPRLPPASINTSRSSRSLSYAHLHILSLSLGLSQLLASASAMLGPRDIAPDFTAQAVVGQEFQEVTLSDYTKAGKWVVLFFYPFDFTFVCPTEIISFSERAAEWEEMGVQVLGMSTDSHHVHLAWTRTPRADGGLGQEVTFPLVADINKDISKSYGVLTMDPTVGYFGAPLRAVYVIDPNGIIRSVTINDEQVGRSIDEVVRTVQAFKHSEANPGHGCPSNWKPGAATIEANPAGSKAFFKEWGKQKEL